MGDAYRFAGRDGTPVRHGARQASNLYARMAMLVATRSATQGRPRLLPARRLSWAAGVLASLGAVGAATLAIYALKQIAPVVSLGVVYILAVLLISTSWGLLLGLFTSVASALAFNLFHLPPTGRLDIADRQNWVGLGTFLLVALIASTVAEVARQRAVEAEARREEADLVAELARGLIEGGDLDALLAITSRRIALALGVDGAALRRGAVEADRRTSVFPLRQDGVQVATLVLPADLDPALRARLVEHVIPSLEALLTAALQRDALQAEVVETAALRQSDEVKTALLRAVSHDLRSPLTSIVASGEALGSTRLDDEDRNALAAGIVTEGERLSRLIDNLLDLSRLEAGTAHPRADWCAVDEVLLAAADGTPGDVRFSIADDLPLVRADAAQLQHAFANLIANAVRHGGAAPVSVRARAVGPRIVVRVVDAGPGLTAADQQRIFEPFWHGDGDGHGSGLGLAIVRGFVEANGGRVHVESVPGQGASFVVELPLEDGGS
jgi:two-component system sensor histidine kinase KdpD